MRKLFSFAKQFASRETAASAVEYALLAALIAVAIFLTVQLFGTAVLGLYRRAADGIPSGP